MVKIAPSILSADFADMAAGVKLMEQAGVEYLHCDVMDGVFVPNITFGFKMIEDIRKKTSLPMDVHLMIDKPERYVERFAEAGADIITVHVEATVHLQRTLQAIRQCGKKAGAVLNPATPLEMVKYVLDDVEMILLMSVNPGYGGQGFIPAVMGKITELKEMIHAHGKEIEIEIDGGVNKETAAGIAAAGADVLVAGSAVFSAPDPVQAVRELRESIK
ncbi:ribulose-phosphate 3-epimerase [Christensenellaceae bacterium OttesenSCG-928-K19]|nr:ribulose-phosphate 3-epimerase [Christensenellaceae bacterium OttesenSCG-928-K19]